MRSVSGLGALNAERARAKKSLASSGALREKMQTTNGNRLGGDLSEPAPSDPAHHVGCEALVIESRGPKGHVGSSPCNVRYTPSPNVPRAAGLEMSVGP